MRLNYWNSVTPFNRTFILSGVDSSSESRHRRATAVARQLRDLGCPSDLALEWLLQGAEKCSPRLDVPYILRLHKETFLNVQRV